MEKEKNNMKETRDTRNSSFHRAMILSIIKDQGSKTITELSTYLKVSRPTIYGHLETLEQKDLIKRDKGITKKGAPVIISLTKKASPVPLEVLIATKKTWDRITNL